MEDNGELSTKVEGHERRLNGHDSVLDAQSRVNAQNAFSIRDINRRCTGREQQMRELYALTYKNHGENQARAANFESMFKDRNAHLEERLSALDTKVDNLASLKSWVAWVLVVVSTSGVVGLCRTIFSHWP